MTTRFEVPTVASHSYAALEGSPTWDVIDRALADLEANRDVAITTARPYVVGYLCQSLARLSQEAPGTVSAWRVLRRAGWDLDRDPAAFLSVASSIAGIAGAGDAGHVALFLRGLSGDLFAGIPKPPDGFLSLARDLVAAAGRDGERS